MKGFSRNLIFEYFLKYVAKIQISVKSDESSGYLIRIPMYISDNMWLSSS